VIVAIERKRKETFRDHFQNQASIAQMKRRLGQHGSHVRSSSGICSETAHRPGVMTVAWVGQCNQITGIRDTVHFFDRRKWRLTCCSVFRQTAFNGGKNRLQVGV
jgi:hypothetical protein